MGTSTTVKRTHIVSRRIAAGLGLAAATIGAVGFTGWLLNSAGLRQVYGGGLAMKANAAFAFVAAGLALFAFAALPRENRFARIFGRGAAALAGLIGLATVIQHLAGVDFGIDQLLVTDTTTTADLYPGRMPRSAAVGFLLFGLAALLLPRAPTWAFWS